MRIPYWSVGLFLMLCPAHLGAENYVALGEDKNGTIYSVDIDSIVKIQHYSRTNVYEAWEERDHSTDKTTKARKTIILAYYDCDTREYGLKQVVVYAPSGDVIFSHQFSYVDFQRVVPGTVGKSMLDFVCFFANLSK
jgi:hypothetical protein